MHQLRQGVRGVPQDMFRHKAGVRVKGKVGSRHPRRGPKRIWRYHEQLDEQCEVGQAHGLRDAKVCNETNEGKLATNIARGVLDNRWPTYIRSSSTNSGRSPLCS